MLLQFSMFVCSVTRSPHKPTIVNKDTHRPRKTRILKNINSLTLDVSEMFFFCLLGKVVKCAQKLTFTGSFIVEHNCTIWIFYKVCFTLLSRWEKVRKIYLILWSGLIIKWCLLLLFHGTFFNVPQFQVFCLEEMFPFQPHEIFETCRILTRTLLSMQISTYLKMRILKHVERREISF